MEGPLEKVLQQTSGPNKSSLSSHLTEVFSYILKQPPSNLQGDFQQISAFVKKNSFAYQEPQKDSQVNKLQPRSIPLSSWVNSCRQLYQKYKEKTSEGLFIEKQPPQLGICSDFLSDCEMFKWVGVSFGEQESYRISMSLKRLLRSSGASQIRFWGKIYGTEKDYYIAEGLIQGVGKEDVQRPKDFQLRGEGVNAYTYWATSSILQDWIELPDATPAQIQVSRQIKKLFTGNLHAQVKSYPIFPGKQRHLLRAQIARITSGNLVVPKGLYKPNQEDPTLVQLQEEPGIPAYEDITSEQSWVHLRPNILLAGRATHVDPEAPPGEEVDIEELRAKQLQDDPLIDRLRALQEDEGWGEEERAWVFTLVGDSQVYSVKPPEEGNVCYGVNFIQNRRWPGAFTVYRDNRWASVYLGYGLKATDPALNPVCPPDVLDDPEDMMEQPEPTPLEAPVEHDSESDEEKKGDDDDDD